MVTYHGGPFVYHRETRDDSVFAFLNCSSLECSVQARLLARSMLNGRFNILTQRALATVERSNRLSRLRLLEERCRKSWRVTDTIAGRSMAPLRSVIRSGTASAIVIHPSPAAPLAWPSGVNAQPVPTRRGAPGPSTRCSEGRGSGFFLAHIRKLDGAVRLMAPPAARYRRSCRGSRRFGSGARRRVSRRSARRSRGPGPCRSAWW